ncbi:hypothetical protein L226DRAFT_172056 [Lentinus tigrinus ALCF2SS1-7]|uniref:Uncharacterized protein n=1 Tax=Lentinus tigrinus ALCF2SS1-6 TaxID=1328759 RepID=A0A5C2RZZ2_9APHY|nr:hypothetical protein L227DRAFT_249095 [Lentinus tigrinus ALCF2SS1-6]RPD71621.1 hypothetical protein L226DRAFT_172056 [Lentinus tigrinus ALCF2SS1-7]
MEARREELRYPGGPRPRSLPNLVDNHALCTPRMFLPPVEPRWRTMLPSRSPRPQCPYRPLGSPLALFWSCSDYALTHCLLSCDSSNRRPPVMCAISANTLPPPDPAARN